MSDRFYRDKSKGVVGGVCAGLSEYFGVAPALLRVIFALWALSGSGIGAYIILWIILPDKATLGIPNQSTVRDNVNEIGSEARSLGKELRGIFGAGEAPQASPSRRLLFLGGFIVLLGLGLLAESLHLLGWFAFDRLWPVVLILFGVVLLNRAVRR
jgi:phage shock protein PspC (stress-responsive transcriptional regulator)